MRDEVTAVIVPEENASLFQILGYHTITVWPVYARGEKFGRAEIAVEDEYFSPLGLLDPRMRLVSAWKDIDREAINKIWQPTTDANISSERVPTLSEDQKDPTTSTDGVGLPVDEGVSGYTYRVDQDKLASIPQPVDASPPVASRPALDSPTRGVEGRAAEITVRCPACRGRGETLWVEQTWNLEECENCAGSGLELVAVDEVIG